jgi:hypothetical protein
MRTPVVREIVDDRDQVLAVIYKLRDGWHIKHDNRHDRFAWEGPYASPEAAAKDFQPISSTGAVPDLLR